MSPRRVFSRIGGVVNRGGTSFSWLYKRGARVPGALCLKSVGEKSVSEEQVE